MEEFGIEWDVPKVDRSSTITIRTANVQKLTLKRIRGKGRFECRRGLSRLGVDR
jgi:hypothetical protein|tara:strand:- start:60 stop:221 length:162 start_codon:yes stop_codon:yes gene_type:complete